MHAILKKIILNKIYCKILRKSTIIMGFKKKKNFARKCPLSFY